MILQSVKEVAKKFNLSERRVQILCESGRIDGACLINNTWQIPKTATKPADARFSTKIKDMLTLTELCKEISISIATGKNWVKLGKIKPDYQINKTLYFSINNLKKIKENIKTNKNKILKSRRNKKYVSGNKLYNYYISENSINYQQVQNVIESINFKLTQDTILALITDCAIKLINTKITPTQNTFNLIEYLNTNIQNIPYSFLIEDLIKDITSINTITEQHPEIFSAEYRYQENEDTLGLLYLSLKNIGNRKALGAYYTPTQITQKLLNNLFSQNTKKNKTIVDPCCGTGNFILQLPPTIDYNNVFANDIDKTSVKIARINYALKYNITNPNIIYNHITQNDYFNTSDNKQYDFIIGNPPWGYEFSDKQKLQLKNNYKSAQNNHIESFDIAIEQSIKKLNNNGVLSFVLPESVLNVKSHKVIRQLLLDKTTFQYIEYLGNQFNDVQCPSIIIQTKLSKNQQTPLGLVIKTENKKFVINKKREINADYFSLNITDEQYEIIKKIESIKNKITLENNSIFALGIVTGDNKQYISNQKTKTNEPILKGSDIYKFKFKHSNNYIEFSPTKFQQVAPTRYYREKEKLLYRFISNQLTFAYDNNGTLSLNSCNILIPQIKNLSIKYILAILNSRIAQFYFQTQFNSIKVLRSHLEQIPIPYINKVEQAEIITIVDKLIEKNELNLYNILDKNIAQLYGITTEQYDLIKNSIND